MSKRNKDKWKPKLWTSERHTEITQAFGAIRGQTRKLEKSVVTYSINTDLDYNELFTAVEQLYSLLEIDKLAMDNERRKRAHLQKVREIDNARQR